MLLYNINIYILLFIILFIITYYYYYYYLYYLFIKGGVICWVVVSHVVVFKSCSFLIILAFKKDQKMAFLEAVVMQ